MMTFTIILVILVATCYSQINKINRLEDEKRVLKVELLRMEDKIKENADTLKDAMYDCNFLEYTADNLRKELMRRDEGAICDIDIANRCLHCSHCESNIIGLTCSIRGSCALGSMVKDK